jgi:hypothetical protein
MNNLAEQIIIDILTHEMALPSGSAWVQSQNKKIPETTGLFVVAGMISSTVLSNTKFYTPQETPLPPTLLETIEIITRDAIQIDILSRNNDAILRRWEVLASLTSLYSVQMQELNDFRIFQIPNSFVNTSQAEGGSNINRFSITIACNVWFRREKLLQQTTKEFYDTFTTRVDNDKTIATPNALITL